MLHFLLSVSHDLLEDQRVKLLELADALDSMNEDAGYIPLDLGVFQLRECIDQLDGALISLENCCSTVFHQECNNCDRLDVDVKCFDSENK